MRTTVEKGGILVLFNTIALTDGDNDGVNGAEIHIRKMGLTTRQYYSRITGLMDTGLIRRQSGRYYLTLLGKMIYDIHITASRLLSYHWKFKAIESIQVSPSTGIKLPEEKFRKVIDSLIEDSKINNMVTRVLSSSIDQGIDYVKQKQVQEQAIKVR